VQRALASRYPTGGRGLEAEVELRVKL